MIWGEEELSGEEAAVREKFREVVAGRFELILRPLKDEYYTGGIVWLNFLLLASFYSYLKRIYLEILPFQSSIKN